MIVDLTTYLLVERKHPGLCLLVVGAVGLSLLLALLFGGYAPVEYVIALTSRFPYSG